MRVFSLPGDTTTLFISIALILVVVEKEQARSKTLF